MAAIRLAALVLFGMLTSSAAEAAVVSSTRISYYTVGGDTPAAIFRGFLSRGPQVSGADAIASIATRATQDAGLVESGGICRLSGYQVRLSFKVTRPRIANPAVLSARDRAMWKQMNSFIIAHEDKHKQIWMSCASALDRRMTALRASSCGQLLAKGEFMWKQMLSVCDKNQRAFDRVQSWQLLQLPFMQRVRKGD